MTYFDVRSDQTTTEALSGLISGQRWRTVNNQFKNELLEIKSFKCQTMFIINPDINVYVENICMQKNKKYWIHKKKSQSWPWIKSFFFFVHYQTPVHSHYLFGKTKGLAKMHPWSKNQSQLTTCSSNLQLTPQKQTLKMHDWNYLRESSSWPCVCLQSFDENVGL